MDTPFRIELQRFIRTRHIAKAMNPLDDESPAEAVLLQHILDAYTDELRHRLGMANTYENRDRHGVLKSILDAIKPLFDTMALAIPEGQNRVCDRALPLFQFLRDISLDVTFTLMGLEAATNG